MTDNFEDRITALEKKSSTQVETWYLAGRLTGNETVDSMSKYKMVGLVNQLDGGGTVIPMTLFKKGGWHYCCTYDNGHKYGSRVKYINDTTIQIALNEGNDCNIATFCLW